MRELRFRAWDRINNKMVYPCSPRNDTYLVFEETGWFIVDHFTGKNETILKSEDGELMHYTGLKDEKENEIYQDDILQDEEATYRVIWCENRCAWDLLRLQDKNQIGGYGCYSNDFFMDFVSNSVKIGTAYEKPELLK